ncbi:MAG: tetratricopeptide repeat protein [Bdellovibrionales bacterium]
MLQQEICPDCGDLIPAERMDEEMVVCTCGYTKSMSQSRFESKRNKTSSYVIIFLSLFLMASFIHTAKWGKESVQVTPLEVSRALGTISPDQALTLGDMSLEKNFLLQAEEMYDIFLQKNPEDVDANQKMGMLLFRQKKFVEAAVYLEKYFLGGGDEQITLFSYGKALTETQDLGNAEDVFLKLIKAKPEMYQITVVQALVDLYIAQDKLVEAKQFISSLIKPGYQIPDHLREQKDFIKELIKKS